jgi:hypothetical protein
MSTVKLGISGMKIPNKIQRCRNINTAMVGNPNFITPNPGLDVVTKAINALEDAYEAASDGGKALKAFVKLQDKALNAVMKQLQAYIQEISGGDQTIILSSGMDVVSPRTPTKELGAVVNVKVVPAKLTGTTKNSWKPLTGSVFYSLQTSADGNTNWTDAGTCTRVSIILEGFVSGSKVWARVAGNNAKGQGPWSSPSQGMAA